MKIADIEIGKTYFTKIGGSRVRVIVTREYLATRSGQQTRFCVRREDETRELPKPRTASALHATARVAPPAAAPAAETPTQGDMASRIYGAPPASVAEIGSVAAVPAESAKTLADFMQTDQAKANAKSWDLAMPQPGEIANTDDDGADTEDEEDAE